MEVKIKMAETVVVNLEVNSSGVGEGVKNLKTQLKEATLEAQALAQKFGSTSKEAIQAGQRTAHLREEIADVNDTINALHPEAKFNAVLKVGSGIAGGFAAAQGALALFGAESDNVQKALLKVQSAMAISQGLNEIRGLQDSFKNLGVVLRSTAIYQKALSLSQAFYTTVVGASTGAMKLLRIAMASTGIGALIVGLGLLVANWGKVTAFVEKNAEAFKKWGLIIARILFPPINAVILLYQGFQKLGEKFEIVGVVTAKIGEKFSWLKDKIVGLLESVGILSTTEEKSADKRIEASKVRETAIKREIEMAKASGASAQELANLEVKLAREKFLAYDQYIKAREKAGREITVEERNQMNELTDALKISKLNALKIEEDAIKKRQEENQKAWDKRKELEKKQAEERVKLALELEDLLLANITDEREREIKILQTTFERKIQAVKGNSATEIAIRSELAIQERAQLKLLTDKFEQEDLEAQSAQLKRDFENETAILETQKIESDLKGEENYIAEQDLLALKLEQELLNTELSDEKRLLLQAQFAQASNNLKKKKDEEQLANDKKIAETRKAIAKGTLGALNSFADIFIKDEAKRGKAKKALALVELGIDTAIAISGMVKSASKLAYPANLLAIVTGVAAVATNIAKAKTLLGGGGPDVSGASTSSPIGGVSEGAEGRGQTLAPRLNSTDSPRTQLLQSEKQPLSINVTANVIETDVTSTQKRIADIKDKATI